VRVEVLRRRERLRHDQPLEVGETRPRVGRGPPIGVVRMLDVERELPEAL
jgi:hypothetical protein